MALMSDSCAWICSKRLWMALPKNFTDSDTNGSGISDKSVSRASIDSISASATTNAEQRVRRVHHRRADHHADGVQVVGGARHQVAGPVRLEVRRAAAVSQMREEVVAHVVLDVPRRADEDAAHEEAEDAADQADAEQQPSRTAASFARVTPASGRRWRAAGPRGAVSAMPVVATTQASPRRKSRRYGPDVAEQTPEG